MNDATIRRRTFKKRIGVASIGPGGFIQVNQDRLNRTAIIEEYMRTGPSNFSPFARTTLLQIRALPSKKLSMSGKSLGPSYTIEVTFEPPIDLNPAVLALRDSNEEQCKELKKFLTHSLKEYFMTFVEFFGEKLGHEHDGYECDWESPPLVDASKDKTGQPSLVISFGINVRCKIEDFAFFESILLGNLFINLYGRAVMGLVTQRLEEAGFEVPEKNVRFSESGFGYG